MINKGPKLSVVHKLVLLLVIPLIVQLGLLGVLVVKLNELEADRKAEARSVEILSYVNLVLNDCMSSAGQMIMFKTFRRPEFRDDRYELWANLNEHLNQLRELAKEDVVCGKAILGFLDVINEVVKEFAADQRSASDQEEFGIDSIKGAAKARELLHRIVKAGRTVIAPEMEARKQYDNNQKRNRELVQNIIVMVAIMDGVIAIIFVISFGRQFARRLETLMDHALSIAIGLPIKKPIAGDDELAQLDSVFIKMASELAQARQKERAVIDNAALIICSLSESLTITMINPAVKNVLDFEPEDMIGKSVQSLFHADDKAMSYQTLKNCQTSGAQTIFVARLQGADGRFHFTEWAITWSQEEKSLFCVVHDITERKEAEQLKQDVIAMVSHDLRAPLTSLSVTLDMLIEGILGELNANGNRMIDNAQQSVRSLIMMINDLLDIERIETGAFILNYAEANTEPLVTSAIDMINPEAARKGLLIRTDVPPIKFTADGDRITRVLVNLLSNAVKFSPKGGVVNVRCALVSDGDCPMVEMAIDDRGPGIPAQKIGVIFQKFQQAGVETAAERSGSGLGLAICKAIVEAHGGRLGASSEVGSGSTFWFRIPLSPEASKVA